MFFSHMLQPNRSGSFWSDRFPAVGPPHRRTESGSRLPRELLIALLTVLVGAGLSPASSPSTRVDTDRPPAFTAALPVWPAGRESEMNLLVEFRTSVTVAADATAFVRVAGATVYRIKLDGRYVGYGPARAGQGVFRIDEWILGDPLPAGPHTLAIEVAGYNCNSYALLDQPSFLQAEVVVGDRVMAATGGQAERDFEAFIRFDRVQRVQRYSFQRPFSEVWRLPGPAAESVRCEVRPKVPLLHRGVGYPTFTLRRPRAHLAHGNVTLGSPPEIPWKDRSLTGIGPTLGGFPESELETIPSIELQGMTIVSAEPATASERFGLAPLEYRTLDFGTNLSGFLGVRITVEVPTRLALTFDEILADDARVDWRRLGCVNIVLLELEPGRYEFETLEPYTLRYLTVTALAGACQIEEVHLRELANPDAARGRFDCSDPRLVRIFEAARETFRQNATDIFMDCPSRERAGWLCDSLFTARVAADFCGDMSVERNFLENFLHPPAFAHVPEGMLPMCHPADHHDGNFIPNWALWFVLQLDDYACRGGDVELVQALLPRVDALLAWCRRYENADGLLERLPGWVFVEWSKANEFVQDVNYPSNMLYAAALDAAARLGNDPPLAERAARLRETIRGQAYDGTFFIDNAVRRDGALEMTTNRSEVCQYMAFFFGIVTTETHPRLWQTLVEEFGPRRKQSHAFPEVHPANAFVGHQLRFELLSREARGSQILTEAVDTWLAMADRTGTLWEHDAPHASCNHGFASHAGHVLYRDVLGLARIDRVGKEVEVRMADAPLEWCSGSIPTPDGPVTLSWRRADGERRYTLTMPPGFRARVVNCSNDRLVETAVVRDPGLSMAEPSWSEEVIPVLTGSRGDVERRRAPVRCPQRIASGLRRASSVPRVTPTRLTAWSIRHTWWAGTRPASRSR
jgi:alpha-L-rhamnosidase